MNSATTGISAEHYLYKFTTFDSAKTLFESSKFSLTPNHNPYSNPDPNPNFMPENSAGFQRVFIAETN